MNQFPSKNYFTLPNEIFSLGLGAGEIAVYAYLRCLENPSTYQCWPSYWTDKEGKITLSGISGTVVVTEVETIPGYTIDENTRTQTVVINPNDTQTLHFYNDPVGGVEIIKVNEDNHSERIPNTTFEIRKVDDALVDTVTTDKNGRVFVALEDGSYYAKEVTSNKSFRLDDTPHYRA